MDCVDRRPDPNPCDADEAVWAPGVDYLDAWRRADAAALRLNSVLGELGIDQRLVRAVPHAGAGGEAVVWVRPEDVHLIARLLAEVAQERRTDF